jgi:1-acyl-sn-glycerol-3-phosphate acyltransferase
MKLLRGTIRLLLFVLITGALSISLAVGRIVLIPFRRASLSWRNSHFKTWARLVTWLLNITINRANVAPPTPFLLVANHLSYIDIIVLASQLNCAFVAKSEVSTWPFIGWLCRLTDTVFIDRRQHRNLVDAMNEVHQSINQGLGVILFAEGTSTNGEHVAPFKSSMLELAARTRIPVYYASISYETMIDEPSANTSVCWWGDMTFSSHFFRMLQLSGFEAVLKFGRDPIVATDRRVLAAKLWQAVNAQFIPVMR